MCREHIELREFVADNPDKDWEEQEKADNLRRQCLGWRQSESVVKKHIERLGARVKSGRESWVRLFATSKVGFNISGQAGPRNNSQQSNMVQAMGKAYCPEPPVEDCRWDPVLHIWYESSTVHAAHLFPWRQMQSMDDIFDKGFVGELFSPLNGLFLHVRVEQALDKGLTAMVPDVNLEPADPHLPQLGQKERNERCRQSESQTVKDYKVVVVNKSSPLLKKVYFAEDRFGISTLEELDGRQLRFQTDFRPRARYIWWTFLNTVLQTVWESNGKVQRDEVRKCTRYWGSPGNYVKKNQLLGFVEELGQDVESILSAEDGTQEEGPSDGPSKEPEYQTISVLV
ncbi:hypothetical protein FDECE_6703 [Fusarium decemcellulare]|nr:hypothetical protein FDECE_6703 [Fusarium decemcellulare]